MEKGSFERAKASVGLSNFIEYYEDYKAHYEDGGKGKERKHLAQKLLETNPKAKSLAVQGTRIYYSLMIFENGWEKEMLKLAMESNHPAITERTRAKARLLLQTHSGQKCCP